MRICKVFSSGGKGAKAEYPDQVNRTVVEQCNHFLREEDGKYINLTEHVSSDGGIITITIFYDVDDKSVE